MTSVFRFPLDAPALTGILLKQGDFGLHQRKKFVILYPSFLVFYDDAERWKLDVKSGTLSGRSGAVYLKSSKVGEAATKHRYAFSVTAPDVRNNKKNLLLIASNEKEKEDWINAINKAIPVVKETKTIIVPPRSPELPRKEAETVTRSPVMETVPKATEVQSPVVGVVETQIPFPTAASAQLDGNSTGDEEIAMSPALPDVAYTTNPNAGITPPIVIVVGDGNRVYTAERGNDGASSVSNLDCGSRQMPTPLSQEECTSSECDCGLLGTALHSLSIENLLDVDSTSDCSRSESGDDYLDDDEMVRAEVDDGLEVPQYWLCKLGDTTCQCPPDNAGGVSPSNSASYGQDETPLPVDNDNLCGTGHTSCPPSEDSQCRLGDTSCQLNGQTSNGPDNTLGDEFHCGLDGDNMCKLKDTTCMQEGNASCQLLPCSLNEKDNGSVSSGLNVSVSSAPSDSVVFNEDSSDDTVKAGSDTSMVIIKTSHDEPSSAAAEAPLASSTTHATSASRTDGEGFRGKSGYILKLSETGIGWNPRYLVIYPGYFCYYKNSSSSNPHDVVKLRKSSVACTATEKHPYQFTVHTESIQNRRSDWVFAAHGKEEMQEWIAAFQLAEQKPQYKPLNFHK